MQERRKIFDSAKYSIKRKHASMTYTVGEVFSEMQRSVESTAVFCGIHCKIRMFKIFDSGIQCFAAKFAAEKSPKEWNRLQRNSTC